LQIPRGHVMNMHKADEIDVCDNCGTFIFLEEAPPE
jgi:predicted  nucleic acid-binding Zn-ribbon protein